MSFAEVILQISVLHKLLITILFNTGVKLFKAMDLHHVSLQSELQSKVLCTSWLGAGMRLFFVVHNFNVPRQLVAYPELPQALVTLIWPFFVVHVFDVFGQRVTLSKLPE